MIAVPGALVGSATSVMTFAPPSRSVSTNGSRDGGGYGPPQTREPERVLRDVREGKVSVDRARDVYRVAIDTRSWTVQAAETARLRSGA